MRFGRMEKRFDQRNYDSLMDTLESLTGKNLNDTQRNAIARGADEIDLVRSGLEETMINAYIHIRAVQEERNIPDLRTAAFVSAILKIANDYEALGIFP